jgi:hypothetical protein
MSKSWQSMMSSLNDIPGVLPPGAKAERSALDMLNEANNKNQPEKVEETPDAVLNGMDNWKKNRLAYAEMIGESLESPQVIKEEAPKPKAKVKKKVPKTKDIKKIMAGLTVIKEVVNGEISESTAEDITKKLNLILEKMNA